MKYAFVTGGNRGLGRGFVDYLSSSGYYVFAGIRKPTSEFKNGKFLEWTKIDVSDDKSIEKAVEYVSHKTKVLDLLINNAGVNKDTATDSQKEFVCSLKELRRQNLLTMFDVNSISPLMVSKYFLNLLTSNPSFIINISSCRASYNDEYKNSTGNYGYRASKAALNMLTHCSTWDLPKNVKTFSVHPGGVKTDMNPTGENDPVEQARKIIQISENWKDGFNGKFLRYNGVEYPL
jgi:NAD(P)-dependent dehydrogenase (short-subunit alcohol dehydrogenase family)